MRRGRVELADKGVAAVRKDHQEAGGHAQQVYPADAFAGRGVRVGKSGLHLFVGVNRIFAKIRKKARRHDFFRSGAPFFVPGRAVFYALPSCSGRNTPSRPPLRPCSGIRFLPPGSFVRALACRRLRFSHYVRPLPSGPFVPALTPPLLGALVSRLSLRRDARFAAPGAACRSVHDDRREIFAEKRRGTFRLFRGVLLYACEPVLFAHCFVFVNAERVVGSISTRSTCL